MDEAKRLRLMARVRTINEMLERLTADLPGELVEYSDEANQQILELMECLEHPDGS